ncbi:exodeoxyribonuclease VII large subunit [Brevibacillus agri]|uniref:exodeoxyribonuclease VII large subunit n=2 Tax=Brevibacillus agri TaxID=51101 RepID=UPI001C8EC185|nr:exodeoxyribonuclease VII large subunit [Brevibacillus agri]MBY0051539.1 exodeoxyribonuclease VII large subunit [Brevibacillus agri]MCG5249886.1 exodeoxyribonuclease VII large subunit [Brevibacillus agri]MDN4091541.1 exodeoxyribonuclease VII large subunit [Brevibacillus agri]MDR9503243.1 exodeoxyribonuclease VII large subunit [Brevibacillus agri]MED1644614.1 exodeoxyribonuclease VII large subunit [Brevibacillus agri]
MAAPNILSVSDLNRYIKLVLERETNLQDVWVRGEISNFTHHSSGHMYFTLKDKTSRIKVVMFASYNRFLRFLPKDGTKAIVRGSISAFERDGAYQLYAKEMQPDGLGTLYLAFEQLKEKLAQEGLFAAERKRVLPRFPKRVGVVTSPTGAAIRDICTTIRRRYPQAEIVLSPAVVQGTDAPASIVSAIRIINQQPDIDVLIVGRGGGSIEELWAFNDESVARAIAASMIPVISAVGHETDVTIADFVADVRAATPTAAAELAVPHYLEWVERVRQLDIRMQRAVRNQLAEERTRLNRLSNSYAMRQPQRRLEEAAERLDRTHLRMRQAMKHLMERRRERYTRLDEQIKRYRLADQVGERRKAVATIRARLDERMLARLNQKRMAFASRIATLEALSPLAVMKRGFSLVYTGDKLVKSVEQFAPGDEIVVRLSDGSATARVEQLNREEKRNGSQENGPRD